MGRTDEIREENLINGKIQYMSRIFPVHGIRRTTSARVALSNTSIRRGEEIVSLIIA